MDTASAFLTQRLRSLGFEADDALAIAGQIEV